MSPHWRLVLLHLTTGVRGWAKKLLCPGLTMTTKKTHWIPKNSQLIKTGETVGASKATRLGISLFTFRLTSQQVDTKDSTHNTKTVDITDGIHSPAPTCPHTMTSVPCATISGEQRRGLAFSGKTGSRFPSADEVWGLTLTVNLRIWNRLGGKPVGASVREFLDCINGGAKTFCKHGRHHCAVTSASTAPTKLQKKRRQR